MPCPVWKEDINLMDPSYTNFSIVLDVENDLKSLIESHEKYYKHIILGERTYNGSYAD